MSNGDFTYSDEHYLFARRIVEKLDEARRSGNPVPEIQIIAQGLADWEDE